MSELLVEVPLWHENGPVCQCVWPEGIPQDYDEFYRDYSKFVANKVKQYNRVDRNIEDLLGDIWVKLLGSDVLTKFVARAARTLPSTLPGREAAALLGMSFDEFMLVCHLLEPTGLDFKPIEGDIYSESAIWRREDLQDIDEAHPENARSRPRRMLWVSPLAFKAYVTQAIHNHFANWCRTRARKYKDMLLPGTALIGLAGDQYYQKGHNFEAHDWESQLVALSMTDEDLISVVETVRAEFTAAGLDLDQVSETETYTIEGDKWDHHRPTEAALAGIELIDSMVDILDSMVKDREKGRVGPLNPDRKPKSYRNPGVVVASEITPFGDGKTIREAVKIQARAQHRLRTKDA